MKRGRGSARRIVSPPFPARLMLEDMSVAAWGEKALAETNPRTALTALLALARVGAKDFQAPLLKALAKFPLDSLDDDLKLLKLRVIKVSFARQGRPDTDLVNLGDRETRRSSTRRRRGRSIASCASCSSGSARPTRSTRRSA